MTSGGSCRNNRWKMRCTYAVKQELHRLHASSYRPGECRASKVSSNLLAMPTLTNQLFPIVKQRGSIYLLDCMAEFFRRPAAWCRGPGLLRHGRVRGGGALRTRREPAVRTREEELWDSGDRDGSCMFRIANDADSIRAHPQHHVKCIPLGHVTARDNGSTKRPVGTRLRPLAPRSFEGPEWVRFGPVASGTSWPVPVIPLPVHMDAHMADALRQLTFASQGCPERGGRLHTAIGASAREMDKRKGSHALCPIQSGLPVR